MDLMATGTSVQGMPGVGRDAYRALSFYSRYHTAGTAGVGILGQDVSHIPGSANTCFGFCFPPPQMVAVALQHMRSCKARAVVVVPDDRQSWFPLLPAATVRSVPVAAKSDTGKFFRIYHQKRKVSFVFRQWDILAVKMDFRQEGKHDDEPDFTGTKGGTPLHGIDLRQTGIVQPVPLVSVPPPHLHLGQAIGHLLRLIYTILPVVHSLLSSLCAGQLTTTSAPTLVCIVVARGRVLCPKYHRENDDIFHFCQWCATPSTVSIGVLAHPLD